MKSFLIFLHDLIRFSFIVSYATSVGATHFQTSAKTNRGLDEVFNHLASSKYTESYFDILMMEIVSSECSCVFFVRNA